MLKRNVCRAISRSGIIQRKRSIKRASILYHAAMAFSSMNLSLRALSAYMAVHYKVQISHTGWRKWLVKLAEILEKYMEGRTKKTSGKKQEEAIHAIDATSIPMEGAGEQARYHCVIDVGDGLPVQTLLSDQHKAESACFVNVQKKKLYLADRAYGRSKSIAHMADGKADFIFRMSPSQISLYSDEKCKQNLKVSELLTGDAVHVPCWCRYHRRVYKVTLAGQKLPANEGELAQKRARKNAVRRQQKIKPETLLYAQWILVLTSLEEETPENVLETYRKRWQIELFFKRGKSGLLFRKFRFSGNEYRHTVASLWMFVLKLCSTAFSEAFQGKTLNYSLDILFLIAKTSLN